MLFRSYAKGRGQIGAARRAVKEAHDAFDQDQIGFLRRLREQRAAAAFSDHPQMQRIHRRARRAFQDHWIEEVGAGLEDPHAQAKACVIAREPGGDGGLALVRRRRADE